MTPAQRIAAIRESATLLSQQSWSDIDLVLRQHNLPVTDDWPGGDDRYGYVVAMIQGEPDDDLHGLHQYLVGEASEVPTGAQPWGQGQLKLFMSHLAVQQQFVSEVASELPSLGVSCFVAHVSIEPSHEWQSVIETALRSCDAMAVFLHRGFHESLWCDQEVGFALARRVPVLPIAIDTMPYGFMGKLQAAKCQPSEKPYQIRNRILQWLSRTPSAQTALAEGLVTALETSGSYDTTRRVYTLLEDMPVFTPVQLQRLETAAKNNSQVRDAVLSPHRIPDLIANLIFQRGGSLAGPDAAPDDESPF